MTKHGSYKILGKVDVYTLLGAGKTHDAPLLVGAPRLIESGLQHRKRPPVAQTTSAGT